MQRFMIAALQDPTAYNVLLWFESMLDFDFHRKGKENKIVQYLGDRSISDRHTHMPCTYDSTLFDVYYFGWNGQNIVWY